MPLKSQVQGACNSPAVTPEAVVSGLSQAFSQKAIVFAEVNWVVALSGGADSMALLHLLAHSSISRSVRCVHVNHGLQAAAAQWDVFCGVQAASLDVPYASVRVHISDEDLRVLGPEAAARQARYRALFDATKPNEVLLTAHHANDQLETVLYRLERGAEITGLAGIRALFQRNIDGYERLIARPLLTWTKLDLVAYLEAKQQAWIEDPSNKEALFRRNFYRNSLVPQLPQALIQQVLLLAEKADLTANALAKKSSTWRRQAEDRLEDVVALRLKPVDFSAPALLRERVKQWLKENNFSLENSQLKEVLRQLEKGSAVGHKPTLKRAGQGLWLQGNRLILKALP